MNENQLNTFLHFLWMIKVQDRCCSICFLLSTNSSKKTNKTKTKNVSVSLTSFWFLLPVFNNTPQGPRETKTEMLEISHKHEVPLWFLVQTEWYIYFRGLFLVASLVSIISRNCRVSAHGEEETCHPEQRCDSLMCVFMVSGEKMAIYSTQEEDACLLTLLMKFVDEKKNAEWHHLYPFMYIWAVDKDTCI